MAGRQSLKFWFTFQNNTLNTQIFQRIRMLNKLDLQLIPSLEEG